MFRKTLPIVTAAVAILFSLIISPTVSLTAQTNCFSSAPQAPTGLRITSLLQFVAVLSAQTNCYPTAGNTGLAGAGISESSLTNQGSITYGSAYNGQTISGKRFTGTVTISGSNITLDGNLWELSPGSSTRGVVTSGSNVKISNSTMRTTSGSIYQFVCVNGGNLTLDRVDISKGQDNISFNGGSNHIVRRSFIHDSSNASSPSGHRDAIEVYGGSTILIEQSTIIHPPSETAAINIAPWSGGASVRDLTVQDNYIDGGNMHFVHDLQSSGVITNTRVKRNKMGGHTYPAYGPYWALNNVTGAARAEDEATLAANPNRILWPTGTSNPDVNRWYYTVSNPYGYSNLSPNRDNQIIVP
jgi:hypothetical protein